MKSKRGTFLGIGPEVNSNFCIQFYTDNAMEFIAIPIAVANSVRCRRTLFGRSRFFWGVQKSTPLQLRLCSNYLECQIIRGSRTNNKFDNCFLKNIIFEFIEHFLHYSEVTSNFCMYFMRKAENAIQFIATTDGKLYLLAMKFAMRSNYRTGSVNFQVKSNEDNFFTFRIR